MVKKNYDKTNTNFFMQEYMKQSHNQLLLQLFIGEEYYPKKHFLEKKNNFEIMPKPQ